MSKTLFENIWNKHIVKTLDDGTIVLYIDRHLIHEVTSPQAFEGLRLSGQQVRRKELTYATMDHNIPTTADERLNNAIQGFTFMSDSEPPLELAELGPVDISTPEGLRDALGIGSDHQSGEPIPIAHRQDAGSDDPIPQCRACVGRATGWVRFLIEGLGRSLAAFQPPE